MSTIRVDNFGPSAGGTTYSARGIAKAWVNFDGTGTIASRDSENVSSLTDNGTGDYTVNFTNAFGAADYAAVSGGRRALDGSGFAPIVNVFSVGSADIRTADTVNFSDWDYVTVSIHGDLA
jgi:hypothetical protein